MSNDDVFKKAQDAVDHSNQIFEATADMLLRKGASKEDVIGHMMFVGAAILAAILVNRCANDDEEGIERFSKLIRYFADQTRKATSDYN